MAAATMSRVKTISMDDSNMAALCYDFIKKATHRWSFPLFAPLFGCMDLLKNPS